jgi:hypothetical protein
MDYYYSVDDQPAGPVPLDRLHELYRAGTITLDTYVVPVGGNEWKRYRTLQPDPQDLAGSDVPGDVAPGATPSASAVTSAPPGTATSQPGYGNLVLISGVLLGFTALLSVIPIVGCITWVMFIPVFITTVILGVLTLQRGGTTPGILILIASVVVLPLFTLIAPIATTALLGLVTGSSDNEESSPEPIAADASPAPSAAAAAPGVPPSPAQRAPNAQATANAPSPEAAKRMVNSTMTSFTNAVNSGSFAEFYRTEVSDVWKKQVTVRKLESSFKAFIDRGVDLTPILSVEPVLDEPPSVNGSGVLTLAGHYPVDSEDVKVVFELLYSREAAWALSGIKVNIESLED